MIWREKRLLLLVLAVLLGANTVFFFTYRVQYQQRLDALDERLEIAEGQLARARRGRVEAERTFQSYRAVERDVKKVFEEHWSTQEDRLTALIAEVKRLALASSMQPVTYGFQRSTVQSTERGRRGPRIGATAVGIRFAVEGDYQQMRRLINLLELSQQFVIVDQIALVKTEGDRLAMNLHLTTMFRGEGPDDRL